MVSWRKTATAAEVDAVRERQLARVLRMPYFRLEPRGECPEHPRVAGIAFLRSAHGALLDRFMRDGCTCSVYGASEAALKVWAAQNQIHETRR